MSGASFTNWRDRLDALLTPDDLVELAGMPAGGAEQTSRPDQLRYRWDAGRFFHYAGARVNRKNLVSLGQIRVGVRAEEFAARHFGRLDATARARLREEVARQAQRRNLDEHAAAAADRLAQGTAEREPAEPVAGLGDAAAWAAAAREPTLHLRVGDSSIVLVVDVSDDPAGNRDTAARLAGRLLDRLHGGRSR